jgi:hypothetical protein
MGETGTASDEHKHGAIFIPYYHYLVAPGVSAQWRRPTVRCGSDRDRI